MMILPKPMKMAIKREKKMTFKTQKDFTEKVNKLILQGKDTYEVEE